MISKIYCSDKKVFQELCFVEGINLLLCDKTENSTVTHSLGKTKFLRLVDFLFLKQRGISELFSDKFYSKLNQLTNEDIKFYVEWEINSVRYKIERSVREVKKVSVYTFDKESWIEIAKGLTISKKVLGSIYGLKDNEHFRSYFPTFLREEGNFNNITSVRSEFEKGYTVQCLLRMYGMENLELLDIDVKLKNLKEKYKKLKRELFGSKRKFDVIKVIEDVTNKISELKISLNSRKKDLYQFDNLKHSMEAFNKISLIDKELDELKSIKHIMNLKRESILDTMEYKVDQARLTHMKKFLKELGLSLSLEIENKFEELISFQRSIALDLKSELSNELELNEKETIKIDLEISDLEKSKSELLSKELNSDSLVNEIIGLNNEVLSIEKNIHELSEKIVKLNEFKELKLNLDSFEETNKEFVELSKVIDKSNQLGNLKSIVSELSKYTMNIIGLSVDYELITLKNKTKITDIEFKYINDVVDTDRSQGNSDSTLLTTLHDVLVVKNRNPNLMFDMVIHDSMMDVMQDRENEIFESIIEIVNDSDMQYILTGIKSQFKDDQLDNINIVKMLTVDNMLFNFEF